MVGTTVLPSNTSLAAAHHHVLPQPLTKLASHTGGSPLTHRQYADHVLWRCAPVMAKEASRRPDFWAAGVGTYRSL